ncbi:MAG: hypothetical protein EA379_07115 [Phycisphaerales bacterium]|nr:MAG: hypothetical protein EA379_07115 [Phycisphaerales bacterium]
MGVYALSIPTALFTAHVLLVLIAHAELAYANFLVDSRIRSWFGSIGVYTVAPMRGRYTEWVIMGVVAWQWWHWWAAIRSHLIFVGPRQLWACIVVGGTLAAALSSALLWWAFF